MTTRNWIRRLFAPPSPCRVPFARPRKTVRPRLESLEERWTPAVLTVNTLVDNITDTSHLSLRDAVTLVNNAGSASALGQSTMPAGWMSQISGTFGQSDTIQFAPGLATQNAGYGVGVTGLTNVGDSSAGPSALAINPGTNVTILGPIGNSGITIERAPNASAMRLFLVASAGTSDGSLTLENLTLTGGDAVGGNGGNAGWGAPAVVARAWAGPSSSTRADCSP
jgi:hypothetical protein